MTSTVENIKRALANEYLKIDEVRNYISQLEMLLSKSEAETLLLKELYSIEEELSILYKSKAINLVPLKNGYLTIGSRPTTEKIDELSKLGITTVVTLLKETEKNVVALGDYIQSQNIDWIWFPLAASKLVTDYETKVAVLEVYQKIVEKLTLGEKIFIHCAAGVHRTGAFTNGLLRSENFSKEESKQLIKKMREVTAREAVKKHWKWSENMVMSKVTECMYTKKKRLILNNE